MKTGKRIVALLMALLMLSGSVPALGQTVSMEVRHLYSSDTDVMEKMMDLVISGLSSSMPDWASSAAKWGAKKLIDELFPGLLPDEQADMQRMLVQIDEKLDIVNKMLTEITDQITCAQLEKIITDFRTASYSTVAGEIFEALQKVDERTDLTEAARLDTRLKLLTTSLNIPAELYGSINTQIDNYTDLVYNMATMSYLVNLDGNNVTLDLSGVLHQMMMRVYKWENAAYDVWKQDDTAMMTYLSLLVLLDEMSITARYTRCKETGQPVEALESRMRVLNGYGKKLEEMRKNAVKKLDDRYRHYWWRGADLYFYTKPNTQDVPQENKYGGLDEHFGRLNGIIWHNSGGTIWYEPRESFWKPFISYQSENAPLISVNQLQQIYQDYQGKKSLWDIFFSESEGNFIKPEGNDTSWKWIIHPDKNHQLTYRAHMFKGDQLYCSYAVDPGVTGKSTTKLSTKTQDLCIYHGSYSEPKTCRNSIGIGVYQPGVAGYPVSVETLYIKDPPKTGDPVPIALYASLVVICGLALLLLRKKA